MGVMVRVCFKREGRVNERWRERWGESHEMKRDEINIWVRLVLVVLMQGRGRALD